LELGALVEGQIADLVVLDTSGPHHLGSRHPIPAVALRGRPSDVRTVVVNGAVSYLIASQRRTEIRRIILEEAPPPLPIVPARPIPEDPGDDYGFDWRAITDLYAQRNDPDPSWWDELRRIDRPVLVLAGGQTSHVDQDELRHMVDRIPTATMKTIDAGHNIHQTRPGQFMEAVDAFLDS
jgi:pimeloyl-ACP methyl ester carboxylesterase